ncbi:MAG: DUF362 domain-containing protein [Candidatus Omnitrophota bacterium]|nr:DUF362 domain-containing protein [Candidatus Omnitrophota bacterium]MBU1928367.1 DUF362 domain-containing protein [Candidatus Omnitrophota bacterium]MBU2035168.1 DUF362 domain-containing protein [Candidatus Omnitrophota bacterium]MBU2258036.1 DUF362 domain-containing protein [Candidatus Omnitrophota bacterium]
MERSMRVFIKAINILIVVLLVFKFPKNKAEANKPPVEENKYGSVLLALDKKTGSIVPVEKRIVNSQVSIVKGNDLYSITKKAINLLGGMKTIVKKGDRVFIKPNYVSGGLDGHDPVSAGEIAHPEVVASVAEECIKSGAKEVLIGEWVERPVKINFAGREGKEGAQVKHLIDLLNKKYGKKIFLINLMEHTANFKYFPSKTRLKLLAIPDLVADSDVVISIPSLKTHHKPSPVSLGMKNFMGIMPSVLYGEPRYKLHQAGLHQVIVDINNALRPDLVVISAGFGMEGRGASLFLGGKSVDVSKRIGGALVIVGKDPVATDATATRIITKDWGPVPENPNLGTPWYVNHLRMASEQGLGNLDSSKIVILGEELDKVKMNWECSDDNVYPEVP